MADRRFDGRYVGNDFKVKRVPSGTSYQDGNYAVKIAKATFDVAGTDSAGVANTSIISHGLGVYIPDNAVILDTWKEIVTSFSSSGAGTVAFTLQSAGDIMAATLTSSGVLTSTVPSQGLITDASPIKLSAERQLTATVATAALVSGKAIIYAAYIEGI